VNSTPDAQEMTNSTHDAKPSYKKNSNSMPYAPKVQDDRYMNSTPDALIVLVY
jgi:hypothetical protein